MIDDLDRSFAKQRQSQKTATEILRRHQRCNIEPWSYVICCDATLTVNRLEAVFRI